MKDRQIYQRVKERHAWTAGKDCSVLGGCCSNYVINLLASSIQITNTNHEFSYKSDIVAEGKTK
jgi:hypothetical protein